LAAPDRAHLPGHRALCSSAALDGGGFDAFYIFCLVSFVFYSLHYTGKFNVFDWSVLWANEVAWLLQPALFLHFVLTFPERRAFVGRHRWSIPANFAPQLNASFTGTTTISNVYIEGTFKDSFGEVGTSGQVLSCSGPISPPESATGVKWINAGTGSVTSISTSGIATGLLAAALASQSLREHRDALAGFRADQ